MMHSQVAIVGAGPYGLSLAAHLADIGIKTRIFDRPFWTWLNQMPQGMFLKSEGFASDIFDPKRSFTLEDYCRLKGHDYQPIGLPIPRSIFCDYALEFQKRLVPHLEEVSVSTIEADPSGYRLTLETGEVATAEHVVLAVGITHYAYIPPEFASVPAPLMSHTSHHTDLSRLVGKRVAIIGGGASAIDCAALLAKAGGDATVIARAPEIRFHTPPVGRKRTIWEELHAPMSGLGPGWRSRLCTDLPLVLHAMPLAFRQRVLQRHLGPAPGWWTRKFVEDKVAFRNSTRINRATAVGDQVELRLEGPSGVASVEMFDRVIAGTGYRVDIRRLPFLSPALAASIQTVNHTPVLSSRFETSARGLYFVGLSSALSFGPMMRFAYGAGFTSRRLTAHLKRRLPRRAAVHAGHAPAPVNAPELVT